MPLDRRGFLAACSRVGITSALFPGVLYTLASQAQEPAYMDQSKPPKITPEMIDQAAIIAGIGPFTDEQKKMMIDGLVDDNGSIKAIRKLNLPNSVAPAFVLHPLPAATEEPSVRQELNRPMPWEPDSNVTAPSSIEDLAFAPVSQLASLLHARKITSLALTQMYLARLKRYDPKLHFVITLTEERALAQAKAADAEIAAGKYRGPLHGIPWGAKDLLAVKGYPTTWGAGGFEHQTIDEDATVVKRLDAAGAVLVAKLTLGALAMGDKWFGGHTRNPWNPAQGSSGSSAGPASAVAAGCVAFAIGSETLGSISSPSTRCGTTGLRPTFGFVPRTGAMALSWTMDKLGPIARSAEDCALVLNAIHGPDGQDTSVHRAPFDWNPALDFHALRVGYLQSDFDQPPPFKLPPPPPGETAEQKAEREKREAARKVARARRDYDRRYDLAALDALRSMDINLIPVELPKLPYGAMVPSPHRRGRRGVRRPHPERPRPPSHRAGTIRLAQRFPRRPLLSRRSTTSRRIVPARWPSSRSPRSSTRSTSSSRPPAASSCSQPISPGIPLSLFPTACAAAMRPCRLKPMTAKTTTSADPSHRSPLPFLPGCIRTPNLPPSARHISRLRVSTSCTPSSIEP